MFGKLLLLGSVVAASLLVAGSAQAQQCGGDFRQEGGGNAGWIMCIPLEYDYPQQPEPAQSPRSRPKKSVNSYISVAGHPNAGDVWATWNHWNDTNSNAAALKACTQVMGVGCTIAVSGWNISVAIARDETNMLWQSWGDDPKQARNNVLKGCEEKKKNCKIVRVSDACGAARSAERTSS